MDITFIKRLKLIGYFAYLIKLKNNTDKTLEYNIAGMTSLNGTNVLNMANSFKVQGQEILHNGELQQGEELEGYIAFLKNDFVTNEPTFYYEGVEYKVSREV